MDVYILQYRGVIGIYQHIIGNPFTYLNLNFRQDILYRKITTK